MARANHYCADCDTHFQADMETHAEVYHNGGVFRGIENGDWKDWERKKQFKL